MNGLDITSNCSIFFQAEDYSGNIIGSNGISIGEINYLSNNDFNIQLDLKENGKSYDFRAYYSNISLVPYYTIYLDVLPNDNINDMYRVLKYSDYSYIDCPTWNESHDITISANTLYNIKSKNTNDTSVQLHFYVFNDRTNALCLQKIYDIKLSGTLSNNSSSIISGSASNDIDGTTSLGPTNDLNFNNNSSGLFDGINSNSSFADIVTEAEETFNSFKLFFSLFPSWVWVTIIAGLGVVIVLRILGR